MDALKSRRRFIKLTLLGSAALPMGAALTGSAFAAERLSEDDPTAQALHYVHDTNDVDGDAHPNHDTSQICGNCQLIQGDDGEDWRPCAVFPGKLVANEGWCSAWVPMS